MNKSSLPTRAEILKMKEEIDKKRLVKKKALEKIGIYINFVTPIPYQGKKAFALGSRLYPKQPPDSTFHEFIIYVLRHELGKEWWESQAALKQEEQHFVFQCFQKFYEWSASNETEENKFGVGWRAIPDGWTKSLINLAFDVCSLLHAVHLPNDFIERLRKKDNYQGVRYEIAVAAIFARIGYKIEFLDEQLEGDSQQEIHPEFIATNPLTNEKIAVEVKSKTREGVLHRKGEFNLEKELKSSVNKMYRNALKQNPGNMPFVVFIDVNLPISKGIDAPDVEWMKIVSDMQDKKKKALGEGKDPCTLRVFTNYSFHFYKTDESSNSGEGMVDTPNNPEFPIKDSTFLNKLLINLNNYGKVPNLDNYEGDEGMF